jgi:hypothetical protein
MRIAYGVLLPVVFLLVAVSLNAGEREEIHLVSIVQLIASPEKFEGQIVAVVGFLQLELEGSELYLHQDDYINHIRKNGVAVGPSKFLEEN